MVLHYYYLNKPVIRRTRFHFKIGALSNIFRGVKAIFNNRITIEKQNRSLVDLSRKPRTVFV